MLKEALADVDGVEVTSFSGLLVDFAKQRGIRVDREGPSGRDGLRLRVADGADEPSDDRHRDVLRPDQPAVVVPVLVADQGDRAARGGRVRAWSRRNVHVRLRDKLVGGD